MALVLTPVPGNGVRVAASCCSVSVVLTGFPLAAVREAVEVAEAEHVCAA